MSRLARHSLIYLSSNVLTAALPFLLLPILTRYLTPLEYGQVATFQTLTALALLVVGLNLHGAVSVQKYKDAAGLPVYVSTSVMISVVCSLLIGLALIPLHRMLGGALGLPAWWLFLALLCGLAGALTWQRLVLWQTSDRPVVYGAFSISLAVANLILSLWLVVALGTGADGRVEAITASAVGFGLLAALLLGREGLLAAGWNRSAAAGALRFGLPLLPHALAGIALAQADRLLIGQEVGLDEAGIYAVAMQLTLAVVIVAESFNRAYVPWLYRQLSAGNEDVAMAVSLLGVIAAVVGTILFTGAALLCIPILLGDEFLAAAQLLVWLAPAVAAQAAYFMFVNFIFYSERNGLIPVVTVSAAVAYVALGLWAVQHHGVLGLAIVYSAVNLAQTIGIFWVAQRVRPMPWLSGAAYSRGFRSIGARLWS
jgi:O-antigen/teichoic acid export membrane protein